MTLWQCNEQSSYNQENSSKDIKRNSELIETTQQTHIRQTIYEFGISPTFMDWSLLIIEIEL